MEPKQPQGGSSDELQFEQAQFDETSPAAHRCAACGQPITDTYFASGDKIVCPRCREAVIANQTGGSGFVGFVKALIAGIGAAILGAAIYFAIAWATGYEFGLIAILVGFMVGIAVRWGSAGRGGWVYQLLAMFLTYTAIVATYVPPIYQEMLSQLREEVNTESAASSATTAPTTIPSDEQPVETAGVEASGDEEPMSTDMTNDEPTPGEKVFAYALLGVLVFVIAFAAPFLAGMQNIMGLIIIGIALYEAWKINKRQNLELLGPYSLAGNHSGTPPAPPLLPRAD